MPFRVRPWSGEGFTLSSSQWTIRDSCRCHPFPPKELRPICNSESWESSSFQSRIIRIGTAELRRIAIALIAIQRIHSIDQQEKALIRNCSISLIFSLNLIWYIDAFAFAFAVSFFGEIAESVESTRNESFGREFYLGKQSGLSFTGT